MKSIVSVPPQPSIQSFYSKEVSTSPAVASTLTLPLPFTKPGDGFTEDELASAEDPLTRKWNPVRDYEDVNIEQLIPGPRAVTFVGRIVNLSTRFGSSPKQPKATGWHFLIIKDDGGAISIKLYFAQKPYPLKLGQLLTFWTVFIADNTKSEAGAITNVNTNANMFPGRVTSDHVMVHTSAATESICRLPLEYRKDVDLPGLMTIDSWLKGGHDGVKDAKLLVCVKSIGATKKLTVAKTGKECELVDVIIFDDTADMRMTLWNELIESAREWIPGVTVLMITSPGYKLGYGNRGSLSIQYCTMIDVEPQFGDADWLRRHAVGLTRKESLMLEIPEGIWDTDAAVNGIVRMLFTLAELDRWIRGDSKHALTGYINVTILDMSLVSLYRRNMLMCTECCGVPIFANSLTTPCRNCNKSLQLSLNPRIVGTLADETGCIAPGKLLWSINAWEQLFGRSIDDIAALKAEETRWFEQRMMWLRIHLVVGWDESVGRLAVLAVKM